MQKQEIFQLAVMKMYANKFGCFVAEIREEIMLRRFLFFGESAKEG